MFGSNTTNTVNKRSDNAEEAMLRLSDDIGKMSDRIGEMSDRIGDMAERIGDMAERILETQRIQGKNLELMQETVSEAMGIMGDQMKASNTMLELLLEKTSGVDLPDFD